MYYFFSTYQPLEPGFLCDSWFVLHPQPPSSRGKGYNPNYNINIYDSWRTDWSGPYGSSATYAKRRPDTSFWHEDSQEEDIEDF